MRCPECNKFVSYAGDEEPEENSYDVDEGGHVTVEVRIHKDCAECSTELKEATIEMEGDVPETFMKHFDEKNADDHSFEVEEISLSSFEESDNPGRPARYQRTLYGVEAEVTVKCSCGETCQVTMKDSVSASSMDECC